MFQIVGAFLVLPLTRKLVDFTSNVTLSFEIIRFVDFTKPTLAWDNHVWLVVMVTDQM